MKPKLELTPAAVVAGSSTRVADALAGFATGLAFKDLPAAAIEAAKRSILDTLAVSVAGARSRTGQSAINAFAAKGLGSATVMGTQFMAHPSLAALVNGTLGHALDFDDVWADDVSVVAEVFAATSPGSNQKIRKDLDAVLKSKAPFTPKHRYVFFVSRSLAGFPPKKYPLTPGSDPQLVGSVWWLLQDGHRAVTVVSLPEEAVFLE